MDSMRTPPKIIESINLEWTMINLGEIYPCRSNISLSSVYHTFKYILHSAQSYILTNLYHTYMVTHI
jgi:hypothetical protein